MQITPTRLDMADQQGRVVNILTSLVDLTHRQKNTGQASLSSDMQGRVVYMSGQLQDLHDH